MRKNAERDVRQRSRAALLAGAAAVVLLAWGWLAPADGSVPGWEPVNAQVAAAVADAEIGEGEARRAGGEAGLAHAAATAATDRPADTAGVAEPAGEVSGAAAVSASEANAGASAAPASEANAVNTGDAPLSAETAVGTRESADAGDGPQRQPVEAAADGRLDINLATAAELDALPGIGPAKAEAIVRYREANGRFGSPEALTDVKGIGDKLLAKLLPLVKAG